ncbi:hypothetical protein [Streptomyces poonensis]|uniref:Membrane protein n=1 Tax=Streptomyces poonensis TaxID=68255 RepID=A0A918PAP4_9ACTN|nr:hypothetical protein [Streptomyces poonensis]GGY95179.1 membrane protein [Streptomyces poonensis]
MGIESDQVVYEYLSRVGDLAQRQQLPSAARVRLVTELRNEIDRHRAKTPVDSPASVRRIIARLGTPDEVVAAAGAADAVPERPPAPVPGPRPAEGRERPDAPRKQPAEPQERRPKGLRRIVPRPRPAEPPRPAETSDAEPAPSRQADAEGGTAPADWWRVGGHPAGAPAFRTGHGDGPYGDLGLSDVAPGFVGGVEIPELLGPSLRKEAEGEDGTVPRQKGAAVAVEKAAAPEDAPEPEAAPEKAAPGSAARRGRRVLARLRPAAGWTNPVLLVAAALLVAGAFVGSLVPLVLGWLIAYMSRRLTRTEAKWAVLGVPGTVAAAGIVWLWGRTEGRWGDPIAEGQMNDAIAGTWPWVLRAAAVASAGYLVWRSQRPR